MSFWLRRIVNFFQLPASSFPFWLAAWISGRRYDVLAQRIGLTPTAEAPPAQRRFILIQIDGLAYDFLVQALALGQTPTLQRLIAQGYRLQRWRCGLPSATPAVQAGLLYGNNWDIPAFRWYEKAERFAPICKFPPHVERIKARVAQGRRGILAGGASYTNMFDGDARLALFTLSAMGRQHFFEHLRGLGWALLFLLNPWSTIRTTALALWELLRDFARTFVSWARGGFRGRLRLIRPFLQVLTNIIFGEIQAFGLRLDVYRGMPAIYANFYGYDEVAHGEDPVGPEALRSLRRIDRHIRTIEHVRRTYWPDMELYIFSDHGMSRAIPFAARDGRTLAQFVAAHVQASVLTDEPRPGSGRAEQELAFLLDELAGIEPRLSRRGQRLVQALRRWLLRRAPAGPESPWDFERGGDVVVRVSGSLAHVYFNVTPERMNLSEVAILYRELLDALTHHPDIGLVLGVEDGRPAVVTSHGVADLTADFSAGSGLPPGLAEPEQATADLTRLLSFPHSGDLVLLGAWDAEGRVVTFEDQVAAHGGIGGPQEYPFFITPAGVPLDLSAVVNARQLYPYFMRRYHGVTPVINETPAASDDGQSAVPGSCSTFPRGRLNLPAAAL
jgi:hypothetical protein